MTCARFIKVCKPEFQYINLNFWGEILDVYKIKFINKSEIEIDDETLEFVWNYLSCLYKNGQILEGYEIIKSCENEFFSHVTLSGDDALNEANNNIYLNKHVENLSKNFEIHFELIGENMNTEKGCTCESPSWYILYADYVTTESPIICGDCGKSVPPYKLPHIRHGEHFDLISWQRDYNCIRGLWFSCLSDRFTVNQLHNPNSQLSKGGRDICKKFEELTGKPFYYYLFQNKRTSKKCPVCHGEWKLLETELFIDYKCEKCRLVAEQKQI